MKLDDIHLEAEPQAAHIGHNSADISISIEARLFNSLSKFAPTGGPFQALTFSAGATVGDVINALNVPLSEVFLVLRNGRDVSAGLVGGPVNVHAVLDDGDVIALSGPVPYSYGYGAPVV